MAEEQWLESMLPYSVSSFTIMNIFWLLFGGLCDYTMEVRNRFKWLDLIDRVPDELQTEVRDMVQEMGIKTIPWKRNAKKQNCFWGGLTHMCEKKRSEKQRRKGVDQPIITTWPSWFEVNQGEWHFLGSEWETSSKLYLFEHIKLVVCKWMEEQGN